MKSHKLAGCITIGLVLFLMAVPGMAKDSKLVTMPYSASINGTQLSAGDYQVSWVSHSPEATVTFKQGKQVSATVEGTVVERPNRYESSSVLYSNNPDGSRTVMEIRFAGTNKVLTFGSPAS